MPLKFSLLVGVLLVGFGVFGASKSRFQPTQREKARMKMAMYFCFI